MAVGRRNAADEEQIRDELKYYDVLYEFSSVILRLNEKASDGESKEKIENRICRLIPAFIMLCGMDKNGKIDISNVKPQKKVGRPKKEVKTITVLQNNLNVFNNWGLCPKCGKKCIKLNQDTILVNYPMFCKVCKKDYLVTWKYND